MVPVDPTALRIHVYDVLLARGMPPTVGEIAAHFGVSPNDARQTLAGLKIGKTVLVDPQTGEIWMAGPFSAVETAYRVHRGNRRWWANCAWDMFGVAMIVNERVRVETRCSDCGESMTIDADPAAAPNDNAIVHFLVPACHWYDDIAFT